ncbi:glycosyltransferase family 39 protein, partial [bacterium]|nr:glycosyltransferase family 39 protein [bacterium]
MASVAERAPGGGGRSGRVFEFLALLLVLAGVAARLRHLSTNRSLWLDESMLAWNILFVPARRLFGPLDHSQVAPVGFLFLERAVAAVLGAREWQLRLLPFVAGCAALPVTWALAKRVVGPAAALVALAIVSACPGAIYYAAEVKPYSVDLFACAGILLLAARHR